MLDVWARRNIAAIDGECMENLSDRQGIWLVHVLRQTSEGGFMTDFSLGELEFKAEDFFGGPQYINHKTSIHVSEVANAILRDKLEKAPRVKCAIGYGHNDSWKEDDGHRDTFDATPSHEARLVLIHPLTEKEGGDDL